MLNILVILEIKDGGKGTPPIKSVMSDITVTCDGSIFSSFIILPFRRWDQEFVNWNQQKFDLWFDFWCGNNIADLL